MPLRRPSLPLSALRGVPDREAAMTCLDRERVEALSLALFAPVRQELQAPVPDRDNVFVVLNALAFVVGTVLAGTDARAMEFFNDVVAETITSLSP